MNSKYFNNLHEFPEMTYTREFFKCQFFVKNSSKNTGFYQLIRGQQNHAEWLEIRIGRVFCQMY